MRILLQVLTQWVVGQTCMTEGFFHHKLRSRASELAQLIINIQFRQTNRHPYRNDRTRYFVYVYHSLTSVTSTQVILSMLLRQPSL